MSFQGWQGAEQIELRHLRYFLATAEELNYRRAAERLRIAQPGLSQQIKKLEEIVGTPLFDRTRRTVRLTLAGELFMHEARKTLAHAESAMLVARRAGRGEVGRIAIGYVGSAAYTGVLTTMVGKFRSSYPEVELQISEMEMQQQLDQLDQGRLISALSVRRCHFQSASVPSRSCSRISFWLCRRLTHRARASRSHSPRSMRTFS